MANDFITMVNRITTELRRSNLTMEAKRAINDAIDEAAKTRFYLNEQRGLTFNTVIGQEYYPDLGLVEIDTFYFMQGGTRYNLVELSNLELDSIADGNQVRGQLQAYSREGLSFRLYPVPNIVVSVYADGYGKLTPWPLVADADTNNWMTYGERYIRALAKSILLKDVIRDYSEAVILEAVADDLKDQLSADTTLRFSTGLLRGTQF